MTDDHLDYFRRRERQERASAKYARSVEARRRHQQAAQYYSRVVHESKYADATSALHASGLL